jgi:hypothetical protein
MQNYQFTIGRAQSQGASRLSSRQALRASVIARRFAPSSVLLERFAPVVTQLR